MSPTPGKWYVNNNLSNISNRFYVRASEKDFNRLTKSGYYFGVLTQNTPDGTTDSNWIIEVQAFDNSTSWTFQRATRSSDKAIFTRIQDNGTWSDWEVLARKSDLNNVSNKLMIDGMKTLSVKWTNNDTLEFYVDNTRVFGILAKWGGNYS